MTERRGEERRGGERAAGVEVEGVRSFFGPSVISFMYILYKYTITYCTSTIQGMYMYSTCSMYIIESHRIIASRILYIYSTVLYIHIHVCMYLQLVMN